MKSYSEFDKIRLLRGGTLRIDDVDQVASDARLDASDLGTTLQQKVSDVVIPIVNRALQNTGVQNAQIVQTLYDLTSKMNSAQMSHYARAGRQYIHISHKMGPVGNLFFRVVFDKLGIGNYCILEQDDGICIICRC